MKESLISAQRQGLSQRHGQRVSAANNVGNSATPARVATGLALVGLAGSAMATGTDYSGITGAVDFTTVATGIIAIFALVAVALVAWKGGKMLLRAI